MTGMLTLSSADEHAPATGAAPKGVIVLERGLSLVSALGAREGQTLTELSRTTGIDKATTLRLARTLMRQGFVYRDGNQRFWLGPMLAILSRNFRLNDWLKHIIQPELDELARRTGETAAFFTDTNDVRLCILVASGWRDVGHQLCIGDTLPMTGAGGEALTRFFGGMPENYRPEVIISLGQRVAELAAMATPVFDQDRGLLGVISLSGTKIRFSMDEHLRAIREELVRTAENIHRQTRSAADPARSATPPSRHHPTPAA